jgi:hypothetical protein
MRLAPSTKHLHLSTTSHRHTAIVQPNSQQQCTNENDFDARSSISACNPVEQRKASCPNYQTVLATSKQYNMLDDGPLQMQHDDMTTPRPCNTAVQLGKLHSRYNRQSKASDANLKTPLKSCIGMLSSSRLCGDYLEPGSTIPCAHRWHCCPGTTCDNAPTCVAGGAAEVASSIMQGTRIQAY